MDGEIGCKIFCERVGISQSTLSRWVAEKVVVPDRVGSHFRQVFTEEDVQFGRELIELLNKRKGEYSLQQMVKVVRRESELALFTHSPPGAPPAPGQSKD